MRYATLLCTAVFLSACADAGETEDMAADTIPADAPAAESISLADVAGTWAMQVMPMDRDTALASQILWATEDPAGWKTLFDGQMDTISIRVSTSGDSIPYEFGPYSSAVRSDGSVIVTGAYSLDDSGRLVSTAIGHYTLPGADSVQSFRTVGTRVVE